MTEFEFYGRYKDRKKNNVKHHKHVILVPKFTSKEIHKTAKEIMKDLVPFVYLVQPKHLKKKACLC